MNQAAKRISVSQIASKLSSCAECRLANICLPLSLHIDDINMLDGIIQKSRPLHRGASLYQAGSTFTSIYAIRAGAVKTWTTNQNGDEQITGFYLPGEVIGLDGLAQSQYTNSAQALQTTSVCEIPFHKLEQLTLKVPKLQHHIFQLMSKEITHDHYLLSLLSKNGAKARVSSLLMSISARHGELNLSKSTFTLPMSRSDIGNFLGLTLETVSRVFSYLQKQKIISANKKEISILSFEALLELASPSKETSNG